MIINYNAKPENHTVQIPPINLPFGYYTASLVNFIGEIEWAPKYDSVYEILSDLICRENGNPNRALGYIFISGGTSSVFFEPTHKLAYKLRVLEINSSELIFRSVKTHEKIIFSHIAVQFEVTESYGRF